MLEHWQWGTYIFFAVFLMAGIVWVWFFLPETKNTTLEEMDRVFGSHSGEQDAELLREAQREVGLTAFVERMSIATAREVDSKEPGEQLVEKA